MMNVDVTIDAIVVEETRLQIEFVNQTSFCPRRERISLCSKTKHFSFVYSVGVTGTSTLSPPDTVAECCLFQIRKREEKKK